MAELSDEELCQNVAKGDTQAFELLVERHQARAYRLACSILGSEAEARDVSQDAFIRLYESANRFDGRSRFSTWFYRVLVNLCIDHKRRDKWWRKLVPLSGPGDDPDAPGIDPPSPEGAMSVIMPRPPTMPPSPSARPSWSRCALPHPRYRSDTGF